MFFFFKSILLVGMAGKTNIIAFGHEELREIAFMGTVANTAAADRHRTMDKFFSHQLLVVAEEAQIRSLS